MSDHLEVILLTNVPNFVDDWLLKSTTPCGELIDQVARNPSDPSKVVVLTKGQDNARQIAAALDNYNLFGSVIQAWYAFMKPSETSKAVTNPITVKDIQEDIEKKCDEKAHGGHCSKKADTKPAKAEDQTGKLQQQRKRRSAKIVDSTETPDIAGTEEPAERRSRTSNRGSSASKDSGGRDILAGIKKEKDSSSRRKSPRCRFCRQSGHATWLCMERPEYYKVGRTTQGINPVGCRWPESCIVKVEELCAGPIIEYIEKFHLQMEEINREEMRIMFAWLTSYLVCYNCGAAGHNDTEGMCKYLPLDQPVTVEEMAHSRKPFCRRMKGIRDKLSFGKIQQHARRANQEFRDRMNAPDPDGQPLKCYAKKEEERCKGCCTESTALGEKRIKTAQSDDYEQVTGDEDDEDEKSLL